MKKVNGMLTSAVITARYGPSASGITANRLFDMASTMPVPDSTPSGNPLVVRRRSVLLPRGMVVTIGDVLFDTDRAEIRSGGRRNMEKLAAFLKANPERKAMIEGFTDSTGSDVHNRELSGRRADAVMGALVEMGIGSSRLSAHGYGEAYPVAGNGSIGGRQMNRRVEIGRAHV